MKKLVASVLAGVAAQSAVLAIFELAKGFAALFWNPAEAAAHFKSAALFGILAVGAGVAGRAVAGDSFSQQAGAAGGGGGGGGQNGQEQQNNLTTRFNGFGEDEQNGRYVGLAGMVQAIRDEHRANRQVMGQLEVTTHALASRITGMSPGDVVTVGAADAGRAIQRAVVSEFADNFGSTGEYERNMGRAR
jgi:hypothetical protein